MGVGGVITPFDVWYGWVEAACRVNEYAAPAPNPAGRSRAGQPAGEDSPGTDFNRRGSWGEAGLFDAGWAWVARSGEDAGLIRRPGKDRGISASVGMVTSRENGWPLFWCWSTSVPEFVAEQSYTRFAVYAILRHGGDYSAAAKDLAARGYGDRMPDPPTVTFGPGGGGGGGGGEDGPKGDGPPRAFKWMSELQFRPQNDKWLWHGYLSRGGVTMLSALWKAGKSTLLSHLLRAFDGRADQFLGLAITPARVLYVSEEHEELWAERRDDLGIADHVGMICRPFRGRPSPAEWAAFIGRVVGAVQEHRFDLVVMDTISKLWPVREENDAGQVEDALMPVWNITNPGAALMLVHHNRKSDGKEFTGSRGSGGLPAFCETLIEFRRAGENSKDRKRILNAAGRYRETPDKLLIELQPSGYVSHGDPDEMTPDQKVKFGVGNTAEAEEWKRCVLAFLPAASGGAKTYADIQQHLKAEVGHGVRREDLLDWLDARTADGEINQLGRGTKSSPFRWYAVTGGAESDAAGDPDRGAA